MSGFGGANSFQSAPGSYAPGFPSSAPLMSPSSFGSSNPSTFGTTPAFGVNQPMAFNSGFPNYHNTAQQQQQPQQPQQQPSWGAATTPSTNTNQHNPGNEPELKPEDRPLDTISALRFCPTDGSLCSVSSWDSKVRVFQLTPKDYSGQQQVMLKTMTNSPSPVLDSSWRTNGPMGVFSGHTDGTVSLWDLQSNQVQHVGRHEAPIKTVIWSQEMNCLVTGGWDKTVKYWDLRQPGMVETVMMPERVHCMAVNFPNSVVVCAPIRGGMSGSSTTVWNAPAKQQQDDLKVNALVYDLRNFKVALRDSFVASPTAQQLPKLSVRTVAISTDRSFFVCAGTEGRVVIQYFNEAQKSQNFTFRGHKYDVKNVSIINPINQLSFFPHNNFFSSCGSDGSYCFWDHQERSRLYHGPHQQNTTPLNTMQPGKDTLKRCAFPNGSVCPIVQGSFNTDGSVYGYAVGYDWSGGEQAWQPNDQINTVVFHTVLPGDMKPSSKNKGGYDKN